VLVLVLLALAAAAALAACGSSSSSSSTGGSTEAAAEEPAEGESEEVAAETGGSESEDVVATAQAGAEEAMAPPETWEGPTEPVKALKGLKLAAISCDAKLGGCTESVKQMAKVAEEQLGWSVKFYDGQSNPKVWNEDIIQAVNEGVDAIGVGSMPPLLIQQGLAAAEAAEIPVVNSTNAGFEPNPTEASDGKPWVIADISMDFTAAGAANADWAIADSDGKANILVTTDESHTAVVAHVHGFEEQIEKACPECSMETMQTTTANVTTQVPQEVVGYLRAHPETEYVYAAYDPMATFLVPAIEQAGLGDKVKILGILGEAPNIEFIRKGEVQATDVAFDQRYIGWAMVDQTLRDLNGDPLSKPIGENVPWQLLEKENLPPPSSEAFRAPFDYAAEFQKVWGLN
jgi:ribose transport system substrate-binding protein